MKNKIILFVLSLLFIPFIVQAEEKYEKMDININLDEGVQVKDVNITILASITSNEELIDRTSEFKYETLKIYKIESNDELTQIDNEYTLKSDENYAFEINKITPKKDITMNVFGADNILINGQEVVKKYFEYTNDYKELNIKYRIYKEVVEENKTIEETKTILENNETREEYVKVLPIKKDETCILGLSMCCKEFHNVSYCIWACIVIVLIILIRILVHLVSNNMENKKYKDF